MTDYPKCDACGTQMMRIDCGDCGGDGETQPGDLYEQDPLWYNPDDTETCSPCSGRGWFYECPKCCEGISSFRPDAFSDDDDGE